MDGMKVSSWRCVGSQCDCLFGGVQGSGVWRRRLPRQWLPSRPSVAPADLSANASFTRRKSQFADGRLAFAESGLATLRCSLRSDDRLAAPWVAANGASHLEAVLRRCLSPASAPPGDSDLSWP